MRRLLLIAALAAASPLDAQSCDPKRTLLDCVAALRKAAVETDAKSKTEQKPTGEQAATGTATSIADFLPRFAGAVALPGVSPDFGGVSFTRNLSLDSEYTLYLPIALQFTGGLRKPTVFKPIVDTLAVAKRPIVKQRLEETLDEFDDPEISIGLTLETRRFGRRLDKHRDELSAISTAVGTPGQQLAAAFTPLQVLAFSATPGCATPSSNNNFDKALGCYGAAEQKQIVERVMDIVSAERALGAALKERGEKSGWSLIPDLINNKPQLTVRATWNPVDAAAGIATTKLSARWEVGIANINATRRFCKRDGTTVKGYADGKFTEECFTRHVTSSMNQALLRNGLRFFVDADTKFDKAYAAPYVATDTASPYTIPGARNITVTAGLGGNLPAKGDAKAARLDIGVGRIWADKAGARVDGRRWLTVTHTQKLAGAFSLMTGVEYSNKAEFKNEPTQKLSANFGVRYKVITEEPK